MDRRILAAGGFLLGVAIGSGSAYYFLKKQLETKYSDLAEKEIGEAKTYYSRMYKKDNFASPESIVRQRVIPTRPEGVTDWDTEVSDKDLERIVNHLKYKDDTKEAPVKYHGAKSKPNKAAEELLRNIFENPHDDENDTEPLDADPTVPFIIGVEEFMESELDYAQLTLTYFAADDVLVDDSEMPIEDVDATVGARHLDQFGRRSKDPKVVYVRNNRLETDFEILRHEGSYAEEIHGIQQPRKERPRKFPKD